MPRKKPDPLAAIRATLDYYIDSDKDGVRFENTDDYVLVFKRLRRLAKAAQKARAANELPDSEKAYYERYD